MEHLQPRRRRRARRRRRRCRWSGRRCSSRRASRPRTRRRSTRRSVRASGGDTKRPHMAADATPSANARNRATSAAKRSGDLDEGHVADVEVHLQTAPRNACCVARWFCSGTWRSRSPHTSSVGRARVELAWRVKSRIDVAAPSMCSGVARSTTPSVRRGRRRRAGAERGAGERSLLVGVGWASASKAASSGRSPAGRRGRRRQHAALKRSGSTSVARARSPHRGCARWRPGAAPTPAHGDHVGGVLTDRAPLPRRGAGARPAPDEVDRGDAGRARSSRSTNGSHVL